MANKKEVRAEMPSGGKMLGILQDVRPKQLNQSVSQPVQPVQESPADTAKEPDPETLEGWVNKYTGVKEQGIAVWLPKEVKKELEQLRVNANNTMPLRSLASALIKYAIQQHQDEIRKL